MVSNSLLTRSTHKIRIIESKPINTTDIDNNLFCHEFLLPSTLPPLQLNAVNRISD